MKARQIIRDRLFLDAVSLIEMRVWRVPQPVPPSTHSLKYSLVYVVNGGRIIGYDNERGKGDHRHYLGQETPYVFMSIERLLADFRSDVEALRGDLI